MLVRQLVEVPFQVITVAPRGARMWARSACIKLPDVGYTWVSDHDGDLPCPLRRNSSRTAAVLRHAEEVTGNVSLTCRYYGISRNCFYKWQRRYQEEGLEGLRDRSSAPHHCPHATDADIVNKIVYLRQNYHFGPMKIRMYLKRYHDIDIACSAIYRILKRLGLNRLPASQRYKRHDQRHTRYEKQLPGNRVQIDVKFIEPIGAPAQTASTAPAPVTGPAPGTRRRAKYYQFTAIDDCTRPAVPVVPRGRRPGLGSGPRPG
ncbi:helix-turn-helix domain-containing protein [Kitasatospora sp. NPDC056731]|uniref:helix-turn-helix domain-containing protein n=1 Tax=Kitasatospora sp. NPDC056731 TaxID=3155422 RepID=UPI003447C4EE